MKFKMLNINEPILKALQRQGYEEATPIQEQAIPHALKGKDILGCAQTGTGKTAAFSIPILQLLHTHDSNIIRACILTPTRELAIQIQENISAYAMFTSIKSAAIFGGVPQRPQERILKEGIDIIVATPGRLNDLVKQGIVDLSHIEIFVLDEADRMLDMGFFNDVKKIIKKLPTKKQTLFFSATMPKEIKALTQTLLHEPIMVEVAPASTTIESIKQSLYYVDKANKKLLLLDLLNHEKVESALIFTRTKSNANRLGKFLQASNINADVIHGNKSQNARQLALAKFKSGKSKVLVATDIAARGIDVNELSHVFNYDIPNEAEAYVHRIGRTGRAGRDGIAISFSDIDELDYVKSIQKLIRLDIPVNREHDYPMLITTPSPKKKQKGAAPKNKQKVDKSKQTSNAKVNDDGKDKAKRHSPKHKQNGKKTFKKNGDTTSTSKKTFTSKTKSQQRRKPQQTKRGK